MRLLKVKRNWFERLFIVAQKMRAGKLSFPARIPRKPTHRSIPIQPLNVGDKGVAKIKQRHALTTEMSGTCLRGVSMYCWDLTQRNKSIGGIGRGYQNPHFLPRSRKARFWRAIVGTSWSQRYYSGWEGWAYGPITQSENNQLRKRWKLYYKKR